MSCPHCSLDIHISDTQVEGILHGHLDNPAAILLRGLAKNVAANPGLPVLLDVSDVPDADAFGIAGVQALLQAALDGSTTLSVQGAGPPVATALIQAGLGDLLS